MKVIVLVCFIAVCLETVLTCHLGRWEGRYDNENGDRLAAESRPSRGYNVDSSNNTIQPSPAELRQLLQRLLSYYGESNNDVNNDGRGGSTGNIGGRRNDGSIDGFNNGSDGRVIGDRAGDVGNNRRANDAGNVGNRGSGSSVDGKSGDGSVRTEDGSNRTAQS